MAHTTSFEVSGFFSPRSESVLGLGPWDTSFSCQLLYGPPSQIFKSWVAPCTIVPACKSKEEEKNLAGVCQASCPTAD